MTSAITTQSVIRRLPRKLGKLSFIRHGTASGRDGYSPTEQGVSQDRIGNRDIFLPPDKCVVRLRSKQNRWRNAFETTRVVRPHNPCDCKNLIDAIRQLPLASGAIFVLFSRAISEMRRDPRVLTFL